jgi:hypothetical protein
MILLQYPRERLRLLLADLYKGSNFSEIMVKIVCIAKKIGIN